MSELQGLRYGTRMATHTGCLEESAKHLGLGIPPGWLYGGTGHAFVISLGPDLCPSGPHCWRQGPVFRLAKNLGLKIQGVASPKATPELCEQAWDHVRASIDAGLPCYGWHWEWLLIHGYNDAKYLTSGRVSLMSLNS